MSHVFPQAYNPVAGTYVLDQVEMLQKLGTDVFVVSPSLWIPSLLSNLPRLRKYRTVSMGRRVIGCPVERPKVLTLPREGPYFEGVMYYLRCRRLVRRIVRENNISLIHAHMILPDGLAAVLLGRELHLPVVCTLHGSDIRIYPYRDRLTRWFTKWTLRNADDLIAVSSELEKRVMSLSGVSKVRVIPNGADPDTFKPSTRTECRLRLGLSSNGRIALFAGNLKPVKGIEFLLQALRQLRQHGLHLYLVGDGESRLALESAASRLHIADLCHFVGRRPHDEVAHWLGAADCVVLPSLSEGMPTILVEAMFCRTPVIATNVGGVPEIIHDRRTGLLVNPGDSAALATAIDEILTNAELRTNLVQNAETQMKGHFTWEANARATMAAYEDLLGGAPLFADAPTGAYLSSPMD